MIKNIELLDNYGIAYKEGYITDDVIEIIMKLQRRIQELEEELEKTNV